MRTQKKRNIHVSLIYIVLGIGFIATGVLSLWIVLLPTPDITSFQDRKVLQSTKIYDTTGKVLLFDLNKDLKRSIVPLEDISPNIRNASIAIEDDRFYQHHGIRPLAIIRAVFLQPLKGKGIQGGSTITQQVVKNSILTREKKISRKIKEWVLALKLERVYSKDQILSVYLNESPYGGNIYGVEEASQTFFNTSAKDVNLAQAAYLAALPKAPTYYSPYGNNKKALDTRKNLVLLRMKNLGFITPEEYEQAKNEVVVFNKRNTDSVKAPHFVFYVQEQLEDMYGSRFLDEKGLKVITTLNYDMQQKAEAIVNKFALSNEKQFNAENAALVAINPKNGNILTMVGSRDYFDTQIDGNFNIALAKRQPGSTFKPFVYAAAIQKGYTRDTVVFDVPTQFSTSCNTNDFSSDAPCYSPVNYNGKFHGPMTFMNALAQSVNIPAVKALYLTGMQNAITLASRLGITTLTDPSRFGLSLVLGGGEVKLLDMVSAYGVFANEGIRTNPVAIKEIQDSEGNVIFSQEQNSRRVLESRVAREINFMLSNDKAREPAFGRHGLLYFPGRDVAAKTGTTNDFRDAWVVGYTPNISVGAWAGNNDNRPMDKKISGFIIVPLWNEFMKEVLPEIPVEYFGDAEAIPQDIKPVLRGVWKQQSATSTKQEIHSILYYVNKDDPLGPPPRNPADDPQYVYWETGVQNWLQSQKDLSLRR